MGPGIRTILLCMLLIQAYPAASDPPAVLPPVRPGPRDKCPVCGMFVARYPDWVAQIRCRDGTTFFFDGAKDLFKFYFEAKKQRLKNITGAMAAVYATDYYTLAHIDATAAYYVVGSDVYGPMGRELVAFSTDSNAEAFMRDHHGRAILRFDSITPALLAALD